MIERKTLHVVDAMCEAYDYSKPSAFSRGMAIDLPGGTRRVFVSGTASVGSNGESLYPGNFRLQARRAFDNARAVLRFRRLIERGPAGQRVAKQPCRQRLLTPVRQYRRIARPLAIPPLLQSPRRSGPLF